MNFFETQMGNKFFVRDMPRIIKALERVADSLEKENGNDPNAEKESYCRNKLFSKLLDFAKTEDLGSEVILNQFHALWVAYCLHADYEVDTSPYDNDLIEIWDKAVSANPFNPFANFDSFDMYMCKNLV